MPFGYWEAKDEEDDLDAEIERKLKRGYPQDNIIFEDSREAVLIQNRREVIRCAVDDVGALEKLLTLFFRFERAEEFRKGVEQFKTDLPVVLAALREMIERAYAGNAVFRKASMRFLEHAQEVINPSLSEPDTFLKAIYENFYKVYNVKAADRLGVIYTPNEIVRFMVESADWLCEKHFGRNLIDRDVEILDA